MGQIIIKRPMMRVLVNVHACCGCGAMLTSIEDAQKHASETGHVLTVQGKIAPAAR